MIHLNWAWIISCLLLFVCGTTIAGESVYDCKVLHVYTLNKNGILEQSAYEDELKGQAFRVSRLTGKITGSVLPTTLASSIKIVNEGSTENSFKAIAHFKEQLQTIEVQEFRDGITKAFVSSSMGGAGIVTGVCE